MLFKGKILAEMSFVFLLIIFAACNIQYKFIIPLLIGAATAFIFMIAISGAIKNKTVLKHILCILAAIIAAAGYFAAFYNIGEKPVTDYLDIYKDTEVTIKAKINKITSNIFFTQFDLEVLEINGGQIKHNFNLDLVVYEIINAEIDDIIETRVIFQAMEEDNAAYNKSNGYFIAAEHAEPLDYAEDYIKNDIKITPAKSRSLFYYLDNIQTTVRNIFTMNIGINRSNILQTTITQETALVYGVFTGRTEYLEPRVKTNFRQTGIAHIMAVSGLHLSIFTGIIFSFLSMLKLHKKLICVIIIICCLCFMFFTGLSISVIRSGTMMILYYLSFLLSRKNDSVTSLFIAGAVICVITPYNILNISFQLSFFATLGIVVTSGIGEKIISKIPAVSIIDTEFHSTDLIHKFHRGFQSVYYFIAKSLVSSLLVTLAAMIFTLPVTSYSFKTLSLISPLINILVSPFITLIFLFALILILFSFVPFLSSVLFLFGAPLYFFSNAVLNIASLGASFKYSSISVSNTTHDMFTSLSVVFFILIVIFFIVHSGKKAVNIFFIALISVCAVFMCVNLIYVRYISKDNLRISYYSNRDNQSIILFHNDYEKADIIDITYGYNKSVYEIRNIILDNGVVNIGSVVLTHYHKRYIQMLAKFMDYCTIDRVFVPFPETDYDREVFSMLFDFSVNDDTTYRKSYELFMYYDGIIVLNDTAVIVNEFYHNSMTHMTVDIWYGNRKFLYLGIGYRENYDYITEAYDIVFYGTHKHNRRDDDYSTNIYASHYGILSDYINNFKNRVSQRLEDNVLEAYDFGEKAQLIYSGEDEKYYPVFRISKQDDLFYYSRKKQR